ncbi:hypothetical protein BHE74_00016875 [Ensete ventricosum]|nr:hypothetical protein BHE74_00016875 [Ensete ventricosum]
MLLWYCSLGICRGQLFLEVILKADLFSRYRITEGVNLPFRVLPTIKELGRTRMEVNVKVSHIHTIELDAIYVCPCVDFVIPQVPMFTASGLRVRFLKV